MSTDTKCLVFAALLAMLPAAAPAQITFMRTYGGARHDLALSVQQTDDRGYIIAGCTESYGAGDRDLYLIKTDSLGDTVWTGTFGGAGFDKAYSVQQTEDGGYIVAGETDSYGAGERDVWLIRTNGHGDTLWTRMFGTENYERGYCVQQTTDGGFAVVGFTCPPGSTSRADICAVRTDAVGRLMWARTYGGTQCDDGRSIVQTTDGGFAIAGYTASFGAGGLDVYLIRIDSCGDTLWTRTFGGYYGELGYGVQLASDGGFVIVGNSDTPGVNWTDALLIKTDSLGNVGVGEGRQTPEARRMTLDIRPNPCAGQAVVRTPFALRVYDASGSLVLSRASGVERQASSVVLDLRGQPSGVYTLRLGSATTRLVVQH